MTLTLSSHALRSVLLSSLALAALLSHGYDWLASALAPLRNLGAAAMAVYGLWLVFGRKVDYTSAPVAPSAHGHGH